MKIKIKIKEEVVLASSNLLWRVWTDLQEANILMIFSTNEKTIISLVRTQDKTPHPLCTTANQIASPQVTT